MCGISGFVDPSKSLHDLFALQQALTHRGPDAKGYYFENSIGLAHNRLSIIDLSDEANQPFYFENLILVFNGEVYNYLEIKEELSRKGYAFQTNSDTEILIKGFHCWGSAVVDKIIGMFAFAVYNKTDQQLYLFRDRLGVKPLFYRITGDTIVFASELKAFLRTERSIEYDEFGFVDYLRYGYTIEENTFFKGIKKLLPGCFMEFSNGKSEVKEYWNPTNFILDPIADTKEEVLIDQLEELLISSFKYRMVSDVPVGIFFSGGVDSSVLVALLSKHFGTVNTFTIGFDDPKYDETSYARKIANYFKTNHTERLLNVSEAKDRLSEFYKIYDEPFYDSSGIPTSLVAQLAGESGMKVVLSSEGGDELFAGYPSYQRYYNVGRGVLGVPSFVRNSSGKLLTTLDNFIGASTLGNKLGKMGQFFSANSWSEFYDDCISTVTSSTANRYLKLGLQERRNLLPDVIQKANLHPIELFMLWDLKYLLPDDFLVKIDRATMFHSLESREPFLDHRLVEFCLRLPLSYKLRNGQSKYLLKKVLERYIPASYFDRPKMGFSIPLFEWFKKDFDQLFDEKLEKNVFQRAWPMIDYTWIEKQLKIYEHSKTVDKELNLIMMWKFLGLMLWHDEYSK